MDAYCDMSIRGLPISLLFTWDFAQNGSRKRWYCRRLSLAVTAVFHTFGFFLFGLCLPALTLALDVGAMLDERYAPYADWAAQLDLATLAPAPPAASWWRSPEAVRAARGDSALPLSGLHLALDPGHIGGEWAEVEGRHFQLNVDDLPVREGELVLEVARLVKAALVELGAEVSLLRESSRPVNPRLPEAYFFEAAQLVPSPEILSWTAFLDYGNALRREMNRMSVVSGDLIERARMTNEVIRPDALISLHINAAPWPLGREGQVEYRLVDSNHSHVLIFGCLSDAELSNHRQRQQLALKLTNGSAAVERELGQALGCSIGQLTQLPPSLYAGKNATRLPGCTPYLWARNLLLLRYVECPTVLLEPYIANSVATYARLQQALRRRLANAAPKGDDILLEYADAVVSGILAVYGPSAIEAW